MDLLLYSALRLFHSILNVKQVMVNSAHWLVLSDKNTYSHDPSHSFLQMVRDTMWC